MKADEIVELKNGMLIHPDDLERYVEMRRAVTKRVDRAVALMHLLGLLENCSTPTIEVDPQAMAIVAGLVDADVCSIQELLDGWIYVGDAEAGLSN